MYLLTLFLKNVTLRRETMSPEAPSNKIGKSVGEKLRAARIAQHYTQSQLAAPDFSVSYISAIERGQIHPSLRALEILAGRLGLTSTQLLPNRSQPDDQPSIPTDTSKQNEEEVAHHLLEAHIYIMQEEPADALILLNTLDPTQLNRQHQLEQRYLQGWAYYKLNRLQEAEYLLEEAEPIAQELNIVYLQLRIINLLANMHAAMHNYPQAIQTHQRCLMLLEGQEGLDPFFTVQVYTYIGRYYLRLDNIEQSLEAFHKALALVDTLTTTESIQNMYFKLSQHYATIQETKLSRIYAYKSIHLQHLDTLKLLRSEIYHYLGHAILQVYSEQARAFIDESLQNPRLQQDPLTLASIITRDAEWHFAQGQLQQAETYAQQAQQLAAPFGDTLIEAEALIVLGRIEYAQQQPDAGGPHFVAGLDMLERLEMHEELADESVQYAQLLEEIGCEHEAFTHFRRAFQSQQKLGR
jgi:transcriptional regulator with XRE-family HTH domain